MQDGGKSHRVMLSFWHVVRPFHLSMQSFIFILLFLCYFGLSVNQMSFRLLLTDCASEAETVVTALTGSWSRAIERILGFTTYLLPVVSVTWYMKCDRWFLRLCVSRLRFAVCPTIPGVGRWNCTHRVLLLFLKAAVPVMSSMTGWTGTEPLTSGNKLFSYGCDTLLCL